MKFLLNAVILILLLSLIAINVQSDAEIQAPSRETRNGDLTMDMNISYASLASFWGEAGADRSGYSVSGAGDVNGDGFDDIIIGAESNREGGSYAGQTYLFLGRSTSWSMDMGLDQADASFIGEHGDSSGESVSGAGDVNGDGFDDILIGAPSSSVGELNPGKTYLFLGKASGWSMDTGLDQANASFIGEAHCDIFGFSVSGAGDVNGDGFDDILIGAYANDEGGAPSAGQTYLFLGKASGWSMDTGSDQADASFIGEAPSDEFGFSVSGAGDVNGDGFDDILIGALYNNAGGSYEVGQTYLILGKETGWSMDTGLDQADASFIGEAEFDSSGKSVSGAGDVNGDGYHDILIGAPGNAGGSDAGQTYLIFGKASGWTMDLNLSNADASFIGEDEGDCSGDSVSGAGDVNGDGFDDILLGVPGNDAGGSFAGKTYLILGKETGWSMDTGLDQADASFIGEDADDWSGYSVSGTGDVNGDGYDDILIGAYFNDEGGDGAGQTYLISGIGYREPLWINDIKVTNWMGEQIQTADIEETVIVEMTGEDSNITYIDRARVNVSFSKTLPSKITVSLLETGPNTGVYKSTFIVPPRCEYFERMRFSAYIDQTKYYDVIVDYPYRPTAVNSLDIYPDLMMMATQDKFDFGETVYFKTMGVDANPTKVDKDFINLSSNKNLSFAPMLILTETGMNTGTYIGSSVVLNTMAYFENITAKSVRNPLVTSKFMVHTPVQIRSLDEMRTVVEDTEYSVSFYNFGYNTVAWDTSFIAPWLTWDGFEHSLEGTPDNGDVGIWDMYIHIADLYGHEDEVDFQIVVANKPPSIINEPVMYAMEDDYYLSDLDCDDDEQGTITWHLVADVGWLNMNMYNGELTGTPSDADVGTITIVVTVDDGNDGWDDVFYNLTVGGINDRPTITTTDITTVTQEQKYYRKYEATDPDLDEVLTWSLVTNATWLEIDNATGVLEGTPGKWDVGTIPVTVIVTDKDGGADDHEFNITVENINDKPEWTALPTSTQIVHGQLFSFDVEAVDPDPDTALEYTIRTEPGSDISIHPATGIIHWVADVSIFNSTTTFVLEVTLKVSDGESFSLYNFLLNIVPTESPICHLLTPAKGAKTPSAYSLLQWEGTDPENETLTYKVYLDTSEAFVSGLRADCFMVEDVTRAEINITGLQPGNTYYWTVIPHDGGTKGTCTNGPFLFKVNNAPTLRSVSDKKASTGKEVLIKVSGSDVDVEDKTTLTFYIHDAPEGMKINSETGKLTWTPSDGQTGFHDITVRLTDGVDTASVTFAIEVEKGQQQNLLIFLIVGALVLVIIALIVFIALSMRKKAGKKGEAGKAEEGDDESEKIAKEMELHRKEKDWELEHHREGASNVSELSAPASGAPVVSDVPLTVEEAHAKDRSSKPLSYEDLYGKPAPAKTDENVSAKELKDHISEQIRELEGEKTTSSTSQK